MTLIDRLSKLDGPCGPLLSVQIANQSTFKGREWELFIEALKGSVDATIELAERVLPGCDWTISSNRRHGKPFSEVILTVKHGRSGFCSIAATPAIALCIALLRAKEASHVGD